MGEALIPVLLTSVAGAVAQTLFAPDQPQQQAAPAAPTVAPVPTMPLPDDDAVKNAKRRSLAEQLQRQGRASTILTGDTDTGSTLG